MIREIAAKTFLGRPLTIWFGILTFLAFLAAATIGHMHMKGDYRIPVKWHPRLAKIAFALAIVHIALVASIYF